MDSVAVTLNILGKDYRVACHSHERESLVASANYLNEKIADIKNSGKIVGGERLAVMAALNITHELLYQRFSDHDRNKMLKGRLTVLKDRIEEALEKNNQLQL